MLVEKEPLIEDYSDLLPGETINLVSEMLYGDLALLQQHLKGHRMVYFERPDWKALINGEQILHFLNKMRVLISAKRRTQLSLVCLISKVLLKQVLQLNSIKLVGLFAAQQDMKFLPDAVVHFIHAEISFIHINNEPVE